MSFEAINLSPRIGTEIRADRATLLGGGRAAEIREILEARGVIAVRGIAFDDEEHLAFSATLGELVQGRIEAGEKQGIVKISIDPSVNRHAVYQRGAFNWHIDGTTDDVPTRASIMSARRISDIGGQTEFANTYAAWDDLPADEQARIAGLKVVHSLETVQRRVVSDPSPEELAGWRRLPPRTHPLVWHHASGRRSLVLGATASHIVGMDPAEGRALLDELEAWAAQPRFVYRHEWTPGDLIIWDNTGTMHRVLPYPITSGRMMHRSTLVGEEALA